MSSIQPFNCHACEKLLMWLWQVESREDDDGYCCYKCGLPFKNGEVKSYE